MLKILFKKKQVAQYISQSTNIFIVLFGLFLIILFMPVGMEIKKQILSMLGVLLSAVIALSSTHIIGNILAGIMIRISKIYKPGDFIELDNIRGRVFNQGLFNTEVQIITRDSVALPNLYLIQHPIRVTRSNGSFISATVSLGYNVSRVRIEKYLMSAAEKTGLGEPFVYVEKLLDHAVEYRVFGFLKETDKLLLQKSELRKMVLDVLHGAGIEIVSPTFMNRKEFPPSKSFIPKGESRKKPDAKKVTNVEKLIFDKANEAGDIEKLKEKHNALLKHKEELEQRMKETDDIVTKKRTKKILRQLDKSIEMLIKEIEKSNKEKKVKGELSILPHKLPLCCIA